jgi:hypothetical protein
MPSASKEHEEQWTKASPIWESEDDSEVEVEISTQGQCRILVGKTTL